MLIMIIRTAILYITIIAAVRFMGKRQISDLQTTELVVTMLLSDMASLAIQNTSEPLLGGIIPMTVLVVSEVLLSGAMIAAAPLRRLICGSPMIVINDGKIDQKQLRRLRMTVEELTEELRQQNVFSVGDVMFGIIETNGKLSILKNPEKENPTLGDIGIRSDDSNIEAAVICDGKICEPALTICSVSKSDIEKTLQKKHIKQEDVFLMTQSRGGKITIIKKD